MSLPPTPTGHRAVAAVLTALAGVGTLALAGCASTRHPTVAELRAVPGATARYPGSDAYVDDEQEGDFGIDSGSPAHLRVFGCAAGAQIEGQVIDWYTRTLEGAGWGLRPSGPQREDLDGLTSGYTWRRGERQFTLRLATTGGLDDLAVSRHHKPGCPVAYESIVQ